MVTKIFSAGEIWEYSRRGETVTFIIVNCEKARKLPNFKEGSWAVAMDKTVVHYMIIGTRPEGWTWYDPNPGMLNAFYNGSLVWNESKKLAP